MPVALPQVVGFLVLLSGTSVYNEILRACLPQPPPQQRRSGRGKHGGIDAGLAEPLLPGVGPDRGAQQAMHDEGVGGVRFVEGPSSRPIAAMRQGGADSRARYTMARWGPRRHTTQCTGPDRNASAHLPRAAGARLIAAA